LLPDVSAFLLVEKSSERGSNLLRIGSHDHKGFAPALLAPFDGKGGLGQMKEFGQISDNRLVGLAVYRRRGQTDFEHIALQPGQTVGGSPGLDMQAEQQGAIRQNLQTGNFRRGDHIIGSQPGMNDPTAN
jgi:hypothetical protein